MSGLGYRVGQKFVRNLKMDSSEFFYEPSVNPNCPISDSILALVREFAFVVDLQPTSLLRKRSEKNLYQKGEHVLYHVFTRSNTKLFAKTTTVIF
jgi:hypothetical protein